MKRQSLLFFAATLHSTFAATSFRPHRNHQINEGSKYSALKQTHLTKSRPIITESSIHERNIPSLRGGDAGTNVDIPKTNELIGVTFFVVLQVLLEKVFTANKVAFPAMLACTVLIFATLVVAEAIVPGAGDAAFSLLQPGANLLTKWLPVMFVPGLALLPLAPSIGSGLDVLKLLSMIALGFTFTMATTSYLVLSLRTSQGLIHKPAENIVHVSSWKQRTSKITPAVPPANTPSKPFTNQTYHFLLLGTLVTGGISMLASSKQFAYATPLRTLFMLFGTFFTYVFGACLPTSFTKVVHPLVISTIGTLLLTMSDAIVTGDSFLNVLQSYRTKSLSPKKTGAADLLIFLLGPAVGCLSIPMYSRKNIMAENLFVVIAAMLCSSIGGLFGTAWYVRLVQLGSNTAVRFSVISRNVTTALSIVITQLLGGDMAIASSVAVLTGIFGATVGRGLLDALHIEDPVSRGLGMGAAGQGLGVASMMPEKEAFPFAAINMVLTAACATALASVPAVRECLKSIVSRGLTVN